MRHNLGQVIVVLFIIAALILTHGSAEAMPKLQGSGPSYTVRRGDTLSDIAARNGVSLQELMKSNSLSGSLIVPGQQLYIPSSGTGSGTSANSNGSRSRATGGSSGSSRSSAGYHLVQAGESLSAIAARYGISYKDLQEANSLTGTSIHVGQTLVVPSESGSLYLPALPVTASGSRNSSLSGNKSSVSSRGSSSSGGYRVKRGDRLTEIAAQYGTTVEAIREANDLSGNALYRGQLLVLPGD